jgi:S-DNA-T family DNA segregation ATPase FtsK/SpoIIIE
VAHVLIAGTTGSGKTELARTMIASLALHNGLHEMGLLLIDPKKRGFFPLGELPHLVRPIAAGGREMLAGLRWAVNQLDRGEPWPALVVFIDELADLLMTVPEAEALITRLVQRGREAGIHVVAATQTPRADVVAGLIRANFPVRIVGRVTDQVEAQIAAGRSDSGAERLAGRGSFVLVAGLELRRFQAAMLAENEIEELYRRVGGRAKLPEPEDLAAIEDSVIGPTTSSVGAGVGKWLPLLAEHGGDVAALRSGEISQAELFRRIGAPAAGAEWQNARAALMLFEQMMGGNGGGE